jgi:hypothetical protein
MPDSEKVPTVEYATALPQSRRPGVPITVIKFTIAMVVCTVACTALSQSCVTDVLYHCTDSLWLDYLQGPGGWVHGTVAGQPGNFGDTIKPGWSVAGLEALWFTLPAASVVVSLVLSRVRWSAVPPNRFA